MKVIVCPYCEADIQIEKMVLDVNLTCPECDMDIPVKLQESEIQDDDTWEIFEKKKKVEDEDMEFY